MKSPFTIAMLSAGIAVVAAAWASSQYTLGEESAVRAARPSVKPPAVRDTMALGAWDRRCPEGLHQPLGPQLSLATPDQSQAVGAPYPATSDRSVGCLWQVGATSIGRGERVTVLMWRRPDGTGDLRFLRNDWAPVGTLPLPVAASARMEGSVLLLRVGLETVRVPVDGSGPPAEVRIAGAVNDFDPDDSDRSDYAYARAFREAPGSRSGSRCSREKKYPQAGDRLRRKLQGALTFYPDALGGFGCSYRVGVVHADGGRRYGVYLVDWVYGLNLNHGQSRIVFLEDDVRYDGNYKYEASSVSIEGSDLVFRDPQAADTRVHIGPDGPPARAFIYGDWQFYER